MTDLPIILHVNLAVIERWCPYVPDDRCTLSLQSLFRIFKSCVAL